MNSKAKITNRTPQCRVCQMDTKSISKLERLYLLENWTIQKLADKFGLSWGSVQRHLSLHLNRKLVKASETKVTEQGLDLIEAMQAQIVSVAQIFKRAQRRKKDRLALLASSEWRQCIETLGKVSAALEKYKASNNSNSSAPTNVDLSLLNEAEKQMYFQINRKLMGDIKHDIIPEYEDAVLVEAEEAEEAIPETPLRRVKPQPEIEDD
jgi:DNA-binding transcriptional ArsR family regulator